MQLGKQVTQQTMALTLPVAGAYAPELSLSTQSLGSYGLASIDHVLVGSSIAADLMEPVGGGTVAVRARDKDNQRVTLVFADEGLQSLMSPPWDIGLFHAGLAARLADGETEALVLTPAADSQIPPLAYLEGVGETIGRFHWMTTLTVTQLVRAHSPDSRPILLDRETSSPPGYIAQGMQESVQAAHEAVVNLQAAAGSGRQPVEAAQALLYAAESRWWSLAQTSPQVASVGLLYAERARASAEDELAKITTAGFVSTNVYGREGEVGLLVDNAAAYPVEIAISLRQEGLTLPGGDTFQVEVQPGRTEIPITVARVGGSPRLEATILAGTHVLGQTAHQVRFVGIVTFLPWIIGAGAVIVLGAVAVLVLRGRGLRKRRAPSVTFAGRFRSHPYEDDSSHIRHAGRGRHPDRGRPGHVRGPPDRGGSGRERGRARRPGLRGQSAGAKARPRKRFWASRTRPTCMSSRRDITRPPPAGIRSLCK